MVGFLGNRYTYVLNNPLSANDPTGHRSEWVDAAKGIAAIAVSVWLPGTGFLFGAKSFGAYVFAGFIGGSISGGLQGGLWGAFSATLFYGIGQSFQNIAHSDKLTALGGGGSLTDAGRAVKVIAHGIAGGTLNTLRGGKFGHGFVSAAATEASSPALEHFNDFRQVVGGALVGGTVSAVTGGKFGNGAITGAFQMAFNHLATEDPFDGYTEKAAARLAALEIEAHNPESVESNREGGGIVYQFPNGDVDVTPVTWSKPCSSGADCLWDPEAALRLIPRGAQPIMDWHTHGGELGYNRFSLEDVIGTNFAGERSVHYVGSMLPRKPTTSRQIAPAAAGAVF